jgi:hypothetical protein
MFCQAIPAMALIGEILVGELTTVFDLDLGIEQRQCGGGVRLRIGLIRPARYFHVALRHRLLLQAGAGELLAAAMSV